MANIAMRRDKNCPKKETCYRYKAQPDKPWQTYFADITRKDNGDCEFYWEMDETVCNFLKTLERDSDENN